MPQGLARILRRVDLVWLVVGLVIGSGIFIVPATVLRQTGVGAIRHLAEVSNESDAWRRRKWYAAPGACAADAWARRALAALAAPTDLWEVPPRASAAERLAAALRVVAWVAAYLRSEAPERAWGY